MRLPKLNYVNGPHCISIGPRDQYGGIIGMRKKFFFSWRELKLSIQLCPLPDWILIDNHCYVRETLLTELLK